MVTGGNGLLGRALCQHLVEAGYHVISVDLSRGYSPLDDVTEIVFDLTDFQNMKGWIDRVNDSCGGLYALINNAALNPKVEGQGLSNAGLEPDVEDFEKVMKTNLTAPLYLGWYFAHLSTKYPRRKLINVISTYGLVPPKQALYELSGIDKEKPLSYSVSKSALAMATKWMACNPRFQGINSNGVAPGGISTDETPTLFLENYGAHTPMGRMAKVDDILGAFEFLLGSSSDYVQGQILSVDGGWTVW